VRSRRATCLRQLSFLSITLDFKVMALFNVDYLRAFTFKYDYHALCLLAHNLYSRVSFRMTSVTLSDFAKYSMTRLCNSLGVYGASILMPTAFASPLSFSAPTLRMTASARPRRLPCLCSHAYSNTVIGTLAVDGRAVTFGRAKRDLGGLLYQM